MPDRFVVDRLEIEGFRGFPGSAELSVEGRPGLFLGPQGTGKTSTLGAIEWCLFGQLKYFKSAESKTDLELVNAQRVDQTCRVNLRLRRGDDSYEIERSKKARIRETTLVVRANGEEWSGADAEEKIYSAMNLTFDDFYRSVYLHQESIRGLITDDPRERDEAIDRLLGLERARNLLGCIPMREVKGALDSITDQKEKLENQIVGATKEMQSQVAKAEAEAAEAGLEESEISIDSAASLGTDLQTRIESLSRENGLEAPAPAPGSDVTSLSRYVGRGGRFLRECRNKVIELTNVDSLRQRRNSLVEQKEQLAGIDDSLVAIEEQLKVAKGADGGADEIESKVKGERQKIEELETRRAKLDATSRLAEDALQLFGGAKPLVCPVCGSPIEPDSVQEHLQELLRLGKKVELEQIDNGLKAAKKRIRELDEAKEIWERLDKNRTALLSRRSSCWETLAQLLGQPLDERTIIQNVDATITSLEGQLRQAEAAYKLRNSAIVATEEIADRVKLICSVLQKREEFDALRGRFSEESKEISGLEQRIRDVSAFKDRLERIASAVNSVQIELANDSVERAAQQIENLYAALKAHPYYSKLNIAVSTKTSGGIEKNTYQIRAFNEKDGKDTYVSGRFSTGQMNCAALAVFFALSGLASHNLGFLVLDDPSQNLDSTHKSALADVLRDIARDRQVLIATQDEELQKRLRESFPSGKGTFVVAFSSWSKKGPELTITS